MVIEIAPFDEDLSHRRILPYSPVYRHLYLQVRDFVEANISTVELIHVGSTAIPDLSGKPMLDIVAVSKLADLRQEQNAFETLGFHRRDVWVDRDDKPYVCGSVRHGDVTYNVNIHICHSGDPVHVDSLAFIKILSRRPDLRRKYEHAKKLAHKVAPDNPERYNRAKAAVILEIHAEAARENSI